MSRRSRSRKAPETSQDIIDKFWKNIISPATAPTKACAVLPPNVYSQMVQSQVPHGVTVAESVEESYQKAKEICEKKVAQIVRECTMINQKYSDPYFDLASRAPPGPGTPGVAFDISQNQNISGRLVLYDPPLPPPPSGRQPLHPPSVKRVGDIFDKPEFFVEGATASDIRQGCDGDCWFLSALTTLCNLQPTSHMIDRVCVARDQDVGVYGFVLYRDGEWISVIIDDKLYLRKADYEDTDEQVRNTWEDNRIRVNSAEEYRKEFQSNSRALYYAQSTDPNETWVPLIEKAFAKAHGDYGAIEAGSVGEGVEDLTGGISTTILTSDILSRDRFWQDLMKVNKEFLFGCGTTDWDDPYMMGRDGIHGGHAYSVLAAKEYKNQRLVQMKNPWGDSEWNGPWSDGSKEWTPEAMQALNHSFGDDGVFWIRYEDMLRKYVIIWRTRLFSAEWKVTQQWTTLAVPWAGEYQDAKFEVVIAKAAPTVIVLSQLDDRYFRGLIGQYRFKLSFRVHRAGEEDYLTRTFGAEFEERSVSVEVPLDAGTYEVRLRVSATRDEDADKVEDVVRDNWLDRREKLLQIGLSYDLAHAKAQVGEAPEKKKIKPVMVTKIKTVTKETTTKTTTTETTKTETEEEVSGTKEKGTIKTDAKESSKDETKSEKETPKADTKEAKAEEKIEKKETDAPMSPTLPGTAPRNPEAAPVVGGEDAAPGDMGDEEAKPDDDDKASVVSAASHASSVDDGDSPWGAVCVVGLRVYCKDADASIRIVRPKVEAGDGDEEKVRLDIDDPARDAAGAASGEKTGDSKEVKEEEVKKTEEIKEVKDEEVDKTKESKDVKELEPEKKVDGGEGTEEATKEDEPKADDNKVVNSKGEEVKPESDKAESTKSDDAVVVEAADAAK